MSLPCLSLSLHTSCVSGPPISVQSQALVSFLMKKGFPLLPIDTDHSPKSPKKWASLRKLITHHTTPTDRQTTRHDTKQDFPPKQSALSPFYPFVRMLTSYRALVGTRVMGERAQQEPERVRSRRWWWPLVRPSINFKGGSIRQGSKARPIAMTDEIA